MAVNVWWQIKLCYAIWHVTVELQIRCDPRTQYQLTRLMFNSYHKTVGKPNRSTQTHDVWALVRVKWRIWVTAVKFFRVLRYSDSRGSRLEVSFPVFQFLLPWSEFKAEYQNWTVRQFCSWYFKSHPLELIVRVRVRSVLNLVRLCCVHSDQRGRHQSLLDDANCIDSWERLIYGPNQLFQQPTRRLRGSSNWNLG